MNEFCNTYGRPLMFGEIVGGELPVRSVISSRGKMREMMSKLRPGQFFTITCQTKRDAVSLQHSVPNLTVNLEMPTGSFRTRTVETAEGWILYIYRKQ